MAVRHGPAYLFVMGSAPILPDGGASWPDYIPWHLNHGFTGYALRLTKFLVLALGLGFPLQTEFPLHSPLFTPAYLAASPGVAPARLRICHAVRSFTILLVFDMLSTGFLSCLPWLFAMAQGNFSPQVLRLYRSVGRPRGLITFPRHHSHGLRSLPVAPDRIFMPGLRSRITVANGIPASFRPMTHGIHNGSAMAGDTSASHFMHGTHINIHPVRSCPLNLRTRPSTAGGSGV